MEKKYQELAGECGIVGAGGAGFPTQVKLNTKAEILVVNGAECEPLMTVDQTLFMCYAKELAKTIDGVRDELGAKQAIIGIKAKHTECIESMQSALGSYPKVSVKPLEDCYPAGDEYVLVYETTGRQIPMGGIPTEVGCVVSNVETLWNLNEASEGRPLTDKWVTMGGEVKNPGTYRVPLGVTIGEMIALAGGATVAEYAVINGGPMMGKLVGGLDEPVTKTTKGLLVLKKDNPVIINRTRPLESYLRQAKSMCCQCSLCTDLCPRHLLGYEIHPNKTILSASYGFSGPGAEAFTQALLCSECGACDSYACPMGLSPRWVNHELKGILGKNKVQNPYKGQKAQVIDWREYRKIPVPRLINRLGLKHYHTPVEWKKETIAPDMVKLLLRQHIGAPSNPVVAAGDKVKKGQLIAAAADGTPVSSALFASIDGTVSEVSGDAIVIKA